VGTGGGTAEEAREDDVKFSRLVCMVRDGGPAISGRNHDAEVVVDPSHRFKAEVHQTAPVEPTTHFGLSMLLHSRAMGRMAKDPSLSYQGATNAELQADPVLKAGLDAAPAATMPDFWSRGG
jgi:hypothetical protein